MNIYTPFSRPAIRQRGLTMVELMVVLAVAAILVGLAIYLKLLPKEARDLVLAGAIFSIMLNPFLFSWLEKYTAQTGEWNK